MRVPGRLARWPVLACPCLMQHAHAHWLDLVHPRTQALAYGREHLTPQQESGRADASSSGRGIAAGVKGRGWGGKEKGQAEAEAGTRRC